MGLHHLTTAQVEEIISAAEALSATSTGSESDPLDSRDVAEARTYLASPERKRLVGAIATLPEDALHEFTALVWYGRHPDQASYDEFVDDAHSQAGPHEVEYLADKAPTLPAYLRRGLDLLQAGARDF